MDERRTAPTGCAAGDASSLSGSDDGEEKERARAPKRQRRGVAVPRGTAAILGSSGPSGLVTTDKSDSSAEESGGSTPARGISAPMHDGGWWVAAAPLAVAVAAPAVSLGDGAVSALR